MTRLMYDSTDIADIPSTATMIAAYVDGKYANVAAARARFPHAIIATIAVSPDSVADVLDCELGDAGPLDCPPWVVRMRQFGRTPTIYCSMSAWPGVRAAFTAAGVAQPQYGIAKYDNQATMIPGAIYKQYGGDLPGHYDLNLVADFWPGIDEDVDVTPDQLMTCLAEFFSPTPTPNVAHSAEGWGRIRADVIAVINPVAIAAAVIAQLPAGQPADQATIENAIRAVLGSLDD